ncbi:MAG TPA: CehA/McbA family metallohydrolase [Gemmataceae bacterium]|nr:CehA/McbA family metallohydrolase [Gemmataceae bacterium]
MRPLLSLFAAACLIIPLRAADPLPLVGDVEGQPLGQNADRVAKALEFLGTSLPTDVAKELTAAVEARDARKIQQILDARALLQVTINPESRVKVARGPAPAAAQQSGFTPALVKVVNEAVVKKQLRVSSPQAGDVFSQNPKAPPKKELASRFLDLQMFTAPPLTGTLSGLKVEYAILLIYSTEAGKREATVAFDVGQGTQDLGFRGEAPVLFEIKPAIAVKLAIKDESGKPTVGRFTFTDAAGHVFPPRAKRVAPDFFFQNQVYRPDGGTVLLPPGEFTMEYGRGPEYKLKKQKVTVPAEGEAKIEVAMERWVDPAQLGWYSGDHHIHGAGCAHYTSPTEGVYPEDMFLHVKGEALNVGCCLTWGPCYEFQRNFFEPAPNKLSEPFTLIKYDVEVSGFGSQALGHVCLLNLRDQTYPGSDGTKVKGWPTWTTPVMKWTKLQGGFTGYAHSANGLQVNAQAAAKRLMKALDNNSDGKLSRDEGAGGLLPYAFDKIDEDGDGFVTLAELTRSHQKAAGELPNLAVPEMNGIGAQEICVSTAMKACDFISAMDTARTPEWNCWYHIMNCGFPLKASGETDFPCISGSRVGQGRVYVQLGKVEKIDYAKWCEGLAKGRSYISDGYSHALEFMVNGEPAGGEVKLDAAGPVTIKAKVAFARELPLGTSVGGEPPRGGTRKVEVVVNGVPVAAKDVPADDKPHDVEFSVPVGKSSWIAIRQSPAMHTNPVNVIVGGKPIRASRASAQWCVEVIHQLWRVRENNITAAERDEARATFEQAIEIYKKIAAESDEGS